MENKVALIGIFVKKREVAQELNNLLTEFGDCIIGRMGIPHREKSVNIICIVVDAPQNIIEELSEKIEKLDEISTKTTYVDM